MYIRYIHIRYIHNRVGSSYAERSKDGGETISSLPEQNLRASPSRREEAELAHIGQGLGFRV